MKKKLVVKQQGNRIYIREIDVKRLTPLLRISGISVHTAPKGKHTGAPRSYISITDSFKFLEAVRSDYIITII